MTYQDMLATLTEENAARRPEWDKSVSLIRDAAGAAVLRYAGPPEETQPFEPDADFGPDPGDENATDWEVISTGIRHGKASLSATLETIARASGLTVLRIESDFAKLTSKRMARDQLSADFLHLASVVGFDQASRACAFGEEGKARLLAGETLDAQGRWQPAKRVDPETFAELAQRILAADPWARAIVDCRARLGPETFESGKEAAARFRWADLLNGIAEPCWALAATDPGR